MTRAELIRQIQEKQSFLCVGLDTDPLKIPAHLQLLPNAVLHFNKSIIEATREFAVAYKVNIAFYEAMGQKGWEILEETLSFLPDICLKIADAKRADIGNTSEKYARTFFETYAFDAVTVAPYMGIDSIMPFLEFKDKWTILLALTSNKGSADFQMQKLESGKRVFELVLEQSSSWATEEQLMYVVGATHPDELRQVRKIVPNHFLLIPGVGAQGGDLKSVAEAGINADTGMLINSSRGIIYAGRGEDYLEAVSAEASSLQGKMAEILAAVKRN